MPKTTLEPHLSSEELERRYRGSTDAVLRSHYQMILLLSEGKTIAEIADVVKYSERWVREIRNRYNAGGPDALGDGRHDNLGQEPILDDLLCEELTAALQGPAPDGGLWTGPKIARWVEARTGRTIHDQRGTEWARKLGFSLQRPRPRHTQADPQAQQDFKESDLAEAISRIREQTPPERDVEVWGEDEHRMGLQPVLRRVWAPIGQSVTAPVDPRRKWFWLYGFVHPREGETFWLILPLLNGAWFSRALEEFAQWVGAGTHTEIALVVDKAGAHLGKTAIIPKGIHLVPLPARSPELQPAERLWQPVDEAVANKVFADIDELEGVVAERCVRLMECVEEIKARTNFYWWHNAVELAS